MDESPRAGTTADLVRRVDRLEAGQNELSRTVTSLESTTKLVQLEQTHLRELMTSRFETLHGQQKETAVKVDAILDLVQKAMSGELTTAMGRQMLDEYRQFQAETREGLRKASDRDEAFDDYVLVQKTREETLSSLARRAFGSSVFGVVTGLIGLALAIASFLRG